MPSFQIFSTSDESSLILYSFGIPIFIPLIDFEQEFINFGTSIFTDVESKLSKPDMCSNIIALSLTERVKGPA